MALPGSGTLSLSDIQTEFGGSNPISLSEYYGVAAGVPASGTIAIDDFYGTSASTAPPEFIFYEAQTATGGSGTYTFNFPSVTAGKYICLLAFSDSGGVAVPTGYTNYTTWASAGNSVQRYFMYKIAAGGETSVSFAHAHTAGVAICFVVSGVHVFADDSNTVGMPDAPSASVASGRRSVAFGFLDDDNITMTEPSGYTLTEAGSVTDGGSNTLSFICAYNNSTGTGTTNPAAFGGAGDDNWQALNVVVT